MGPLNPAVKKKKIIVQKVIICFLVSKARKS